MKRHNRDDYYVVGEGIFTFDSSGNACRCPSILGGCRHAASSASPAWDRLASGGHDAEQPDLRDRGSGPTTDPPGGDPESSGPGDWCTDSGIPAGFTSSASLFYDPTKDITADQLGQDVDELVQGRSPWRCGSRLSAMAVVRRRTRSSTPLTACTSRPGATSTVPRTPRRDIPFTQVEHEGFSTVPVNRRCGRAAVRISLAQ